MKFKDFSRLCKLCFFLFSIHGKVLKENYAGIFSRGFSRLYSKKNWKDPVLWASEIHGAQHKISMEKANDFLVGQEQK